jgi:integrase
VLERLRWALLETLAAQRGLTLEQTTQSIVTHHLLTRLRLSFSKPSALMKLPFHVPYDCRHTFVRLMLMGGAKLGYVSTQIGHRTVATTLRHYCRWVQNDEGDQRQADILEPRPPQCRVSTGAGGGT